MPTNTIKAFFTIDNLTEAVQGIEQMLLRVPGLTLHREGFPALREGMTRFRIDERTGFLDIRIICDVGGSVGRPVGIEVSTWRKNRTVVRALPHGGFGVTALRRAIERVVAKARAMYAKEQQEIAEFVAERAERDRKDAVIRDAGLGTTGDTLRGVGSFSGITAEWTSGHGLKLTGDITKLVEIAKMIGLWVSE